MGLVPWNFSLRAIAVFCCALLVPGNVRVYAQAASEAAPLSQGELESLVAPVALYPDNLLGEVLAASTYPLEVVEARRWLTANSNLQGQNLVSAAAQQDWEPSVQALVAFPSILQQMDQNLKWTTAMGNAFLAQQQDVMSAIQTLRQKAQANGALQSNAQQTVQTQQADGANVIVIEQANPEVIYVPTYNPMVVFGAEPMYPYPAIGYPSTGEVIAAGALSFAAGVALGSYFNDWDGGWGWGVHWGSHSNVVVNNNFITRNNFHGGNRVYAGSGTAEWSHNAAARRGVPYSSAAVANRYGAAAGIRTPRGAAGAIDGPERAAAGITTPRGSAGAITTPMGSAARISTPDRSAIKTPQGTFTNPKPDMFGGGGFDRGGERTMMNSQRGASSMSEFRGSSFGGGEFRGFGGGGGGGFHGGGFGGGGFRGGGGGRGRR